LNRANPFNTVTTWRAGIVPVETATAAALDERTSGSHRLSIGCLSSVIASGGIAVKRESRDKTKAGAG
jgi:hypothetical protein